MTSVTEGLELPATARRAVNSISNRLSLRTPQQDSLEILARLTEIISLSKDTDAAEALRRIQSEFSNVEDFERNFPSLAFALATGVGKTRLMGAFITYLFLEKGIRNFFVLAPNLTIYNKLIADFTPNTPKYVFQGIAEFAGNPPVLVTGDNYASGVGTNMRGLFSEVNINVFNISKISSEMRGGKLPRIKRLSEYIGQSYFDYLAELKDLVLIMDEAHRYRADRGVEVINELRPVLGLELTATPQIERGTRTIDFKNVIYSYPLSEALNDGYVKEPAVATRENFNPREYTPEQLEKLKLEDGVRIHEYTKVALETYALESGRPRVKPFMLVVAQDTTHANELMATIKSDAFFEGRYKGAVITVHSGTSGEERDETVEQLVTVENPDNPTEIVIHVNMLKEGWDVTNLYTIVPLRAANSKTLVEQSIGRGLRLPYGRRVGVEAVDRLTIVAHDRFQEIVDEANRPESLIRKGVVIGRDIPAQEQRRIAAPSRLAQRFLGGQASSDGTPQPGTPQGTEIFTQPAQQQVAKATLEALNRFTYLASSGELQRPEVQREIAERVMTEVLPRQSTLGLMPVSTEVLADDAETAPLEITPELIQDVVSQICNAVPDSIIDIPRIVVVPTGEVSTGFTDFDLDASGVRLQPASQDILIQNLSNHQRERLKASGIAPEARPENYLVRHLIDYDDVFYDEHAELLYKLSGQLVAHLRSYLPDEETGERVLQYHGKDLAKLIHAQMQAHAWTNVADYEVRVAAGFEPLRENSHMHDADEPPRPFRDTVDDRGKIRRLVFTGFRKCLYTTQKFHTDTERRFAVLLEDDATVLKWFKPAPGQFQIYYENTRNYEPDFVVETDTAIFMCEPKRADQIDTREVQAKREAAERFCEHASAHSRTVNGKPWQYLLIPHDEVRATATLAGLAARF